VAHHLTPVFGYYRFAVVDDYLNSDPTVLLRRPKVFIDESRQLALDKGELQRLVAAPRPGRMELALVAMMALLGLRISEAIGAKIEDLGMIIRGQPTLKIVGKGGKPATIPLPRRVHGCSSLQSATAPTGRSSSGRPAGSCPSARGPGTRLH
jgi:integrase